VAITFPSEGEDRDNQAAVEATHSTEPDQDPAELIEAARSTRPLPLQAETYLGKKGSSFSNPVEIMCNDSNVYVVKGRQAGRADVSRAMVNDHIVGRLGALLDAPVPQIALVEIPLELIEAQLEMQHIIAGIAHGSRIIEGVSDKLGIQNHDLAENRSRFSLLAVLFGWVGAGDSQFFYKKAEPYLVYSFDHGHFFPEGPKWTEASLAQQQDAWPDQQITQACSLRDEEIRDAVERLRKIDNRAIAEVVAGPPDEWGLTQAERVTLFQYLAGRSDQLLKAYASQ